MKYIDCFIYQDVSYTTKMSPTGVSTFQEFENGTLLPQFLHYYFEYRPGNIPLLEKLAVERDECIFGNMEEMKLKNPELFI